jgi:hypothetical protein
MKKLKLPKKLKVGGVTSKVVIQPMYDSGTMLGHRGKILVSDELCQEEGEEVICHEITEKINKAYELNLPHNAIQVIGTVWHQVLKDNDMSFIYKKKE